MESHLRQKPNPTGDPFTFPSMSPDLKSEPELADQLFSNGKLVLHAFPVQPTTFTIPRSEIMSRTSSISSKSSLTSSRSNSTNSRSSSSSWSSARTSGSEAKLSTINCARSGAVKSSGIGSHRYSNSKECQNRNYCNSFGHSQRWQFISPVPVLNRRNSSRRRRKGKRERDAGKGFCRRFFGWLVATCQECHAIEPSKRLKVSI
ncbi:hypothetical protein SSX86_005814 [Deinandra increscens subsp. villosa]|uniref:Uncharacterized protein n=1 Tax=Deinandra increscens subsp. villosa TaxID=3103831 RepID=A0AAP0DRQ2_9ASTR